MNILMVQEFRDQYDKVEIIRHDNKTTYINCINYYDYPSKESELDKLIKSIDYGTIELLEDKIKVCRKIKN